MKRFIKVRYFVTIILFIVLFSLPPMLSMKVREKSLVVLVNSKCLLDNSLGWVLSPINRWFFSDRELLKRELQGLKLENHLLEQHLSDMEAVFNQEEFIGYQLERLERFVNLDAVSRHYKQVQRLFNYHLQGWQGKVVYRDSSSWNSSLWLRVDGAREVSVNSPVVLGNMLVGLVDYVGDSLVRVRLITDSGLTPAVRVLRGAAQHEVVGGYIDRLLTALVEDDLELGVDREELSQKLIIWRRAIENQGPGSQYLAKGIIQGSGAVLGRKNEHKLRGIGFNYNYPDEEGPSRDLRSGEPADASQNTLAQPIIMEGDILVTTGMDGIFPPGLSVAQVTKVLPLKEGNYYYNIEADPVLPCFNSLQYVYILPAIESTFVY